MDAGKNRKADSGKLKCVFAKWCKYTPHGWVWWLTALAFMIFGLAVFVLTLILLPSLSLDGWTQRAAPGVNKGAWLLLLGIYMITIAMSMTVIHLAMIKIRCVLIPSENGPTFRLKTDPPPDGYKNITPG